MYQVFVRERFKRALKKLDPQLQQFIVDELEAVARDPFGHPQIKRIQGIKDPTYRLRVGRWRVIYLLFTKDKTIEVLDLFLKKSSHDYRQRLG